MPDRNIIRKKSKFLKKLIFFLCLILFLAALGIFIQKSVKKYLESFPSLSSLKKSWSVYDYNSVYDISIRIIDVNPMNNTALNYHGCFCFYIGVSGVVVSFLIYCNSFWPKKKKFF